MDVQSIMIYVQHRGVENDERLSCLQCRVKLARFVVARERVWWCSPCTSVGIACSEKRSHANHWESSEGSKAGPDAGCALENATRLRPLPCLHARGAARQT